MGTIYIEGDGAGGDYRANLEELDQCEDFAALRSIGGPGKSDDEVDDFLAIHDVEVDPEVARAILRPLGAWDDQQLEDDDDNIRRLVWIIGGALYDRDREGVTLTTY